MFSALLFHSATKCQDSMYKGHYCHCENLHSGDPGLQLQSAMKTKEEKYSDCKDVLFVKRINIESKFKCLTEMPPPQSSFSTPPMSVTGIWFMALSLASLCLLRVCYKCSVSYQAKNRSSASLALGTSLNGSSKSLKEHFEQLKRTLLPDRSKGHFLLLQRIRSVHAGVRHFSLVS